MMTRIRIGEQLVGDQCPCFVIAEAGSNHNCDLSLARQLIDVAVAAGADAVKFQVHSAETHQSRYSPQYTMLQAVTSKSTWEVMKEIELPRDWLPELASYARQEGILFMASVFDRQAVDQLDVLGVPAFKIASFEITDLDLIGYAASKLKPMIISTGMADYRDIADAITTCRQMGNDQIMVLQCCSLYPAPAHLMNLRAISTMCQAFGVPAGLSDHSEGTHIASAAVALGAVAVEKHYTLDRTLPGPDHRFALEPHELKEMVRGIRDLEQALGDGLKWGPAPEEEEHYTARRSLFAAFDIPRGTVITDGMLIAKRPASGLRPAMKSMIVGRRAMVDIKEDMPITWEAIR